MLSLYSVHPLLTADSQILEDVQGELTTRNYPNDYEASKVSLWTIKGPLGSRVQMEVGIHQLRSTQEYIILYLRNIADSQICWRTLTKIF